ncbi:MAG: copper resistance CopC/CopD family protein [bacterium]
MAGAHALLERSVPAGGAVLQRAPADVLMTFTETPEPSLSVVHVVDSTGRQVDGGGAQPVPGQPLELRVPLGPVPNGVYTVTWRTVSRVDGHVTGGAFAFGVGVSPGAAPPPSTTNPFPSPAAIASRWALYLGLSGLIGAAWVWTAAFESPPAAARSYPWFVLALAFAGVVGLGAAQSADAGVSLGRLLATALGAALWWRCLPIVAAGVALAAGRLRPGFLRPALVATGVLAAGSMLADVLAGHAAASAGPLRWPNIADQWIHFVSVGVWLGGLAALLVALGQTPSDAKAAAARRFSTVAGVALGATAFTGILRAIDEVGHWNALLTTDFGRLVIAKAALLLVLAVVGARNRYRSIPTVLNTLRGLRRLGGVELAVAVAIFGITGVLTGLAPPRLIQQAARTASAIAVDGSDFATSVRVHLEVAPGFPGQNRFLARIVDYDTGRPITGASVSLRFEQPDRPAIGPSTLALARTADGVYEGQGTNLSLDGTWSIVVVVERGLQSTEVPFTVAARVRPETVHTISAPGQPTLYGIDLPGGRLLNTYLDPGKPGFNEVHDTYIDANGKELPIPRLVTITVARPGEAPQALPVRRFSAGHFIGDARLGPGDWHLEFTATARDGSVLQATLTVHL